ncbi:hypothetical protein AC1031_018252 [Aphanomyces cochlioides]|nr:hypothetical protein AC1031_018252 [Aphanomyces cochlioides]
MVGHQPPSWRTDIIPIARRSTTPIIIVDTYKSVKTTEFAYDFADSINVAAVETPAMGHYDWILRTDIDTFLTPVFATWKPSKLTVGSGGGYCVAGESTCDRMKAIAKKLHLAEPNLTDDVGSSWYGPAKLIQQCARTSMRIIAHLHEHEFTAWEKRVDYYYYNAYG